MEERAFDSVPSLGDERRTARMALYPRCMELFGLPLHPLVIHAAVVLVPLTMIGAVVVSFWRRGRERYGTLVLAVAVISAIVVVVAVQSGEALRSSLPAVPPLIATHETWGSALMWPSFAVIIGIAFILVAQWMLARDPDAATPPTVIARSRLFRLLGAAVNVASAVTGLVLVVLAGHSGATAVWG